MERPKVTQDFLNDLRKPEWRKYLEGLIPPGTTTVDRLINGVLREVAKSKVAKDKERSNLEQCSPRSLAEAVEELAYLGLELGGSLATAAIVRRGKSAQLMVGYKGYIQIALRSPDVLAMDCKAVHEGDEFRFYAGTEPRVEHVIPLSGRGRLIGSYAVAWLANGAPPIAHPLTMEDIEKRKAIATMRSIWEKWPAEMAAKSAVHIVFDRLPRSIVPAAVRDVLERQDAREYDLSRIERETTEKASELREKLDASAENDEQDDVALRLEAKRLAEQIADKTGELLGQVVEQASEWRGKKKTIKGVKSMSTLSGKRLRYTLDNLTRRWEEVSKVDDIPEEDPPGDLAGLTEEPPSELF